MNVIGPDCPPQMLKLLAVNTIRQACKDIVDSQAHIHRKNGLMWGLDALFWITGPEFEFWAEAAEFPFADPYKMLANLNHLEISRERM